MRQRCTFPRECTTSHIRIFCPYRLLILKTIATSTTVCVAVACYLLLNLLLFAKSTTLKNIIQYGKKMISLNYRAHRAQNLTGRRVKLSTVTPSGFGCGGCLFLGTLISSLSSLSLFSRTHARTHSAITGSPN